MVIQCFRSGAPRRSQGTATHFRQSAGVVSRRPLCSSTPAGIRRASVLRTCARATLVRTLSTRWPTVASPVSSSLPLTCGTCAPRTRPGPPPGPNSLRSSTSPPVNAVASSPGRTGGMLNEPGRCAPCGSDGVPVRRSCVGPGPRGPRSVGQTVALIARSNRPLTNSQPSPGCSRMSRAHVSRAGACGRTRGRTVWR